MPTPAARAFRMIGMWVVTCCCCVAVIVPVLRGGAPDPGAVGILGIIAGFLFTNTKPAPSDRPDQRQEPPP